MGLKPLLLSFLMEKETLSIFYLGAQRQCKGKRHRLLHNYCIRLTVIDIASSNLPSNAKKN